MLSFDPTLLISRHKFLFEAPDNSANIYSFDGDDRALQIADLVTRFAMALGTTDLRTAGAIFFKRYCPIFAGAVYAWLHHRWALDVSYVNMKVTLTGNNVKFHLLGTSQVAGIESLSSDEEKDEAYMRHLFQDHASPLVAAVSAHTGISQPALWHTIAYSISYWRQEWLAESETELLNERIEQWFRYATSRSTPSWLPDKRINPISCEFRALDDPLQEGHKILIRKACCMNYKLPGEEPHYCYTCPLISDEQRMEQYLEAH
ncbi:IucA/IucC family C-terminal-domain containing protein [Cohnella yongneupensis]|uniref:IucA/IucC family C-terminal-domain containing protein n=1 Tax=Cohnella yongneupensis TaxID=425006 RepID=A0ABW0QWG3_9BACL